MCLRIESPHQPRRQRRVADLVGIDHAKPLLEEAPVDPPPQLGERVISVDDLVEPRLEEIAPPAVPPLLGPHRITLRQADGATESRSNGPINLQEMKPTAAASCKCNDPPIRETASKIRQLRILHRRLSKRHIDGGNNIHKAKQQIVRQRFISPPSMRACPK
jgi:hypothetical protein